uniref:ATP-dependent RNA helicase DDX42 n=1 Tax=Phallusia mammillata TaxID=59560 RepID=A0A6F9DA16_9ASCI|nr:ATP-dependent RNA helicase DDX42-like [Phallusia mammillata]
MSYSKSYRNFQPASSETNAQGYNRQAIVGNVGPGFGGSTSKMGTKRKKLDDDDDDYFDDVDAEPTESEILAACPFLSEEEKQQINNKDDEEDPLDAFMAGIENEVQKQTTKVEANVEKDRGVRDDLEDLDSEELYFKYMEENPNAGKMFLDDEDQVEYDEEGNPIPVAPTNKRLIDPLPVIYHSEIEYKPFEKNFYVEHEEIRQLSNPQVIELRQKLGVKVSGFFPPKPVSSFGHFGFDAKLLSVIRKQEYTQPTPIQAQGIPCGLSGRDVIGIAKTGSGKTAAFIWPLLVHIMDQPNLKKGDGPIGLIVAPTRELCQQIHAECRRFGKAYGINTACCFGGGNMYEQQKALAEGCEIVAATPGRIIDHVKKGNTNLLRVTYLVFDEADRMFEMGFEYQVRSIANQVRPSRQTLLFSATFRKRIERLARAILTDPVRIVQGDIGEANTDVTQIVEVFKAPTFKWKWLTSRIVPFTSEGSLLIFVTKKANAEELAINLKNEGFDVALIHGDMNQFDRNTVITKFKKNQVATLVATDVAARGLDIPSIKNVINYDVARDIDTHTHRIGRTGRAGQKGTAYTLITQRETQFAGDLVRNMESANQRVPEPLMQLALQNQKFRNSRYKQGRGKQITSFPVRDRPGLGAASSNTASAFRQATAGVLGGRASSIKEYFKNQYKSNFVQSTDSKNAETWNSGDAFKHPDSKKKKKSRWDS